jgi:hypothetical protein
MKILHQSTQGYPAPAELLYIVLQKIVFGSAFFH